jgi:hypothetical protein
VRFIHFSDVSSFVSVCVSKNFIYGVRCSDSPAASHSETQSGMGVAGRRLRGSSTLIGEGAEAGQSKFWGRLLLGPFLASNAGTIHTLELGATTIRRDGSIGRSESYRSFDYLGAVAVPIGDRVVSKQNPYRRCENANRDHIVYSVLSIRAIVGRGPCAAPIVPDTLRDVPLSFGEDPCSQRVDGTIGGDKDSATMQSPDPR